MARILQVTFTVALMAASVAFAGLNDVNQQGQQAAKDSSIAQANSLAVLQQLNEKVDSPTTFAAYVAAADARFNNHSTATQQKLDNKQPIGNYLTGVTGDCSALGPGLASIICTMSNGSAFGSAAFFPSSTFEPAIAPGTTTQYYRGDKTWQAFPLIPAAQVNSDWNATAGVEQILNKPSLGTAASHAATDFQAAGSYLTTITDSTSTISSITAASATAVKSANDNANTRLLATAQAADSAKLGGAAAATVVAGAAAGATALQSNQVITISGDGSGSGTTAIAFTEASKSAAYQWSNWTPSDVAGTVTNASSVTAQSLTGSYATLSNSGGTLTVTFTIAGKYLVSVLGSIANAQTYTYERMYLKLGGTATRYIYRDPIIGGSDATYSWDLELNGTFLVSATANQTLTVLPTIEVGKAGGSTSNYNVSASMVAVYVGP